MIYTYILSNYILSYNIHSTKKESGHLFYLNYIFYLTYIIILTQ